MNELPGHASARIQNEAEFHDARIKKPDEKRLSYAYTSVTDVYRFSAVPPECWNRAVLEIGCFRGDQALELDRFTGRYTGIDISPAAVEHCQTLDLPSNFKFGVDDANTLDTIEDGSIDYAFGHGVLHHLDLDRFGPALARKLARGGFARFVEPAQGNIVLRTFRRMTPQLRTPDERPFDRTSIQQLERQLEVVVTYHALVRPYAPMLFMNSKMVTNAAKWLDDRLLKVRAFQDQAWLLQIELRSRK
jgi:SAM-dependent methyltransferase